MWKMNFISIKTLGNIPNIFGALRQLIAMNPLRDCVFQRWLQQYFSCQVMFLHTKPDFTSRGGVSVPSAWIWVSYLFVTIDYCGSSAVTTQTRQEKAT